jgi:hypothetical protein
MDYCHQHNLVDPDIADAEKKFGIKVSLPPGDPLMDLLGEDWDRVHWYATELERDRAYDDMALRHPYNRDTDIPSQVLEKIFR